MWVVWWCTHAKLTPQTPHSFPGIASQGLCRNKGEHFGAENLSAPITPLLIRWCDYILLLGSIAAALSAAIWWWRWSAWIIFFFPYWVTSVKKGGKVKFSIGAGWRLCHSRTDSILWHIVKMTNVTTWFHPSELLSMTGRTMSAVRVPSPISCRAVITH